MYICVCQCVCVCNCFGYDGVDCDEESCAILLRLSAISFMTCRISFWLSTSPCKRASVIADDVIPPEDDALAAAALPLCTHDGDGDGDGDGNESAKVVMEMEMGREWR